MCECHLDCLLSRFDAAVTVIDISPPRRVVEQQQQADICMVRRPRPGPNGRVPGAPRAKFAGPCRQPIPNRCRDDILRSHGGDQEACAEAVRSSWAARSSAASDSNSAGANSDKGGAVADALRDLEAGGFDPGNRGAGVCFRGKRICLSTWMWAHGHTECAVQGAINLCEPVQPASTLGPGSNGDTASAVLTSSEERRVGKECRSRWSPYH